MSLVCLQHLCNAYIDESIVNVALPAIETDLATSVVVIQWLVNAYTLCLAAFLLAGGAAGDLFGRRRVFVIGMTIFALASLLCGLSFSVTQLILARALQGIPAQRTNRDQQSLSHDPSTRGIQSPCQHAIATRRSIRS